MRLVFSDFSVLSIVHVASDIGNMIHFKDMMALINSGAIFSISFVTWNSQSKKGGRLVHRSKMTLLTGQSGAVKFKKGSRVNTGRHQKNPNHFENKTLNLVEPGSEMINKVHTRLITRFNGKKVVW